MECEHDTNNNIQPGYLNFLHGGRMTKFKGIAASIAPMMGAAVLFAGMAANDAMAAGCCIGKL